MPSSVRNANRRDPRSVSEISHLIQGLLKSDPQLSKISVIGEVSGYAQPASGHSYFSLRDRDASLRCVMFRYGRGHQFLEDGAQVVCQGGAGIYAPRGELQIVVTSAEPAGIGDQQAQLEELRRKLRAEGLFDPSRKRPIPHFPKRIAVVTSEQGAVWHDIVNIVRRRYPLLELVLLPSAVQGQLAPDSIIEAITELHSYAETERVDAVIVARGGGSPEDLMAYNDEMVARTIFASRIPVISAVGHETDFTIADDVADVRAPTPSAAAELVSPDSSELLEEIAGLSVRMDRGISQTLLQFNQQAEISHDRLNSHPPEINRYQDEVNSYRVRFDDAWMRFHSTASIAMEQFDVDRLSKFLANNADMARQRCETAQERLIAQIPNPHQDYVRNYELLNRLNRAWDSEIAAKTALTRQVDGKSVERAYIARLTLRKHDLDALDERLALCVPSANSSKSKLGNVTMRLIGALDRNIGALRTHTNLLQTELRTLAPTNILERGYAMVREQDGRILTGASQMNQGDIIELIFSDGRVETEVHSTFVHDETEVKHGQIEPNKIEPNVSETPK